MASRADVVRRRRAVPTSSLRPLKVVVTGPFSAGKTTLIKAISEVAVVGTERDVTDETRAVKTTTTVAMDFGRITLAGGLSLFLFGTPGQRRFEMMWEILSEGMIGLIVLVNAADRRSLEEAQHILGTFEQYADVPVAVGVTHLDEVPGEVDHVLVTVRRELQVGKEVPVLACDPRERKDVKQLLLAILFSVLARLEAAGAAG